MTNLKVAETFKTAGQIYRDRFGEYYHLALTNSFWLFVPIYGWAKYAAMLGLLARLAHGDATNSAESITEAKRQIRLKTWLFFGAGLMSSLIFCLKLILLSLSLLLLNSWILKRNLSLLFNPLYGFMYSGIFFYYLYWLMSRLFLYDLPLSVGEGVSVKHARDRMWALADNYLFKI